jgi:hypothetical protein
MLLSIESAHMPSLRLRQWGWLRYGVKPYLVDSARYRGAGSSEILQLQAALPLRARSTATPMMVGFHPIARPTQCVEYGEMGSRKDRDQKRKTLFMHLLFSPLLDSVIWIGGGSIGFILVVVVVVLLLRG